jgi:LysM repeat protein
MIYRRSTKTLILAVALFSLLSYHSFADNTVHVVARGETVYSISRLHKISQEELLRINNLADASKLQVGMRLVIPTGTPPAETRVTNPPVRVNTSATYTEYTVSRNDTLYSIARTKNVTLQALRDINGFSKNYVLKAGEKIKIPASASANTQPAPKPPARSPGKIADSSIRWPVATKEVTYMTSNSGVLVSGRESESIKSLTGGTVVYASLWRGYGSVAVVETEDGYRYLYGACETLSVRKGDIIEPGTELGKLGIYPASGKPELVLIVSQNGSPVDPAKAPRF